MRRRATARERFPAHALAIALAAGPALGEPRATAEIVAAVRHHYECVTPDSDPGVRLRWSFAASDERTLRASAWPVETRRHGRVFVVPREAVGLGVDPVARDYDPRRCRVTAREVRAYVDAPGNPVDAVASIPQAPGWLLVRSGANGGGASPKDRGRSPAPPAIAPAMLEGAIDWRRPGDPGLD